MQEHLAGNLQKLFKSTPRFCRFDRTSHGVAEKIRAGNDNKISPHKSGKFFRSGGSSPWRNEVGCARYIH